jgi:acyl dehydratase
MAPYFEDLQVGRVERGAPAVTLTGGMAAVHQAIVGDRLALALDATLARAVLGAPAVLAHPALVWDVAIGQSTLLTGRVIANLFYRGLVLQRMPVIGDTLSTSTEVVALRQTTPRPGRPASGLAALRVRTSDQAGRAVLDFWRCAMLPLRDPDGRTASIPSSRSRKSSTPGRYARRARTGDSRRSSTRAVASVSASPPPRPARAGWSTAATWSAPRPSSRGSASTWPPCTTTVTPTAKGAGSSTAATRSGSPPRRPRASCPRS